MMVKRPRALVIHSIVKALEPSLPSTHLGSLRETSADKVRGLWCAFTPLQPRQEFLKRRIQGKWTVEVLGLSSGRGQLPLKDGRQGGAPATAPENLQRNGLVLSGHPVPPTPNRIRKTGNYFP